MPFSFSTKLLTATTLRDHIGGPSRNPSSVNYVPDAVLTAIVDRYKAIAESIVNETVDNITPEELMRYRKYAVRSRVVLMPSPFSDNIALGKVNGEDYVAYGIRGSYEGQEFAYDERIQTTANLSSLIESDRYNIIGDELYVTPSCIPYLDIWLVPKVNIYNEISNNIAVEINTKMVEEASIMLQNRVNATSIFKQEAKIEAP